LDCVASGVVGSFLGDRWLRLDILAIWLSVAGGVLVDSLYGWSVSIGVSVGAGIVVVLFWLLSINVSTNRARQLTVLLGVWADLHSAWSSSR